MIAVIAIGQLNLQSVKADSNTSDSSIEHDVYVAGSGSVFIGSDEYATSTVKYWKNGVEVMLTNGSNGTGAATSILTSGTDVYVTGYEGKVAKYWKNGIAVNLTDGRYPASAAAIAISGNDVYVVGHENSIAKLWKNGTAITLSNSGDAKSIVISNGDVYIAGNKFYSTTSYTTSEATCWKYTNSLQTITLTDSRYTEARANSIDVSGNDIYVVGWERGNPDFIAKLWKNGIDTVFADASQLQSVKVSWEDVYVTGYQRIGSDNYVAKYWKNGIATELPNGNGTSSIAISGEDVYVTGHGKNGAVYWKNGVEVVLPNRGSASSIHVTSNDASLKSLNVSPGTFAPIFDKNITSYVVNIENAVTEIEVFAVASDNNATITGNSVHALNVGSNKIDINVIASNEKTIKTYTIYAIRAHASNNADLKNINIEPGLLVPSFDANITNYTVNFTSEIPHGIIVTSEAADANANVSGNGYYPIDTNDNKPIDIVVTAEDGTTVKTYTITVNTEMINNINAVRIESTIIYPNPTKHAFFIKSDYTPQSIEIYNQAGICVKKETTVDDNKIDVSDLSSGLYFICIYIENRSVIQKLIII
jgi:hypothetical protein